MPGSRPHVALMRGINVGGKNKLPMKDLVTLFVDAGCTDVQTYIQSGNVVFHAPRDTLRHIPQRVSAAIADRFGYAVPVVLRSAAELRKTVRNNPFLKPGVDTKLLSVMFLADRPRPAAVAALDPDRSPPDEFAVAGREIYLCCPGGVARTKLTNQYFDSRLSTIGTARNWATVLRLSAMTGPAPQR
ncbi:MAG: DUF1697 domain-containing protein [bacterium]|nr:DUF1697 domain-containing protein [bacterium]